MPMKRKQPKLEYDKENDVLYLTIGRMDVVYGDEVDNGYVVFRDYEWDEIQGITIFDFKKKFEELCDDKHEFNDIYG